VVILLTIIVGLGVKSYARFSVVVVFINILVLCFVTVCGIVYGHISNWTATKLGELHSGFMPFGWTGVLTGTATCFWGFSGFETISCAVEESRSPQRHIPIATVLTLLLVTSLYVGTAAGMTLLTPCQLLDTEAPIPSAFANAGLRSGHYITSIGPLFGFTTAFISSTFGFVRISLAMAEDGLLWGWFADVNKYTQVPVLSVLACGLLEAVIACFCDIRNLISFSVCITLLSYAAACAAVIILRYSDSGEMPPHSADGGESATCRDADLSELQSGFDTELYGVTSEKCGSTKVGDGEDLDESASEYGECLVENGKDTKAGASSTGAREDDPASASDRLLTDEMHSSVDGLLLPSCQCFESCMILKSHACVKTAVALMSTTMFGLSFVLMYGTGPLESGHWWAIVLVAVASCTVAIFVCIIYIHRQTLQTAVITVNVLFFCIGNASDFCLVCGSCILKSLFQSELI